MSGRLTDAAPLVAAYDGDLGLHLPRTYALALSAVLSAPEARYRDCDCADCRAACTVITAITTAVPPPQRTEQEEYWRPQSHNTAPKPAAPQPDPDTPPWQPGRTRPGSGSSRAAAAMWRALAEQWPGWVDDAELVAIGRTAGSVSESTVRQILSRWLFGASLSGHCASGHPYFAWHGQVVWTGRRGKDKRWRIRTEED